MKKKILTLLLGVSLLLAGCSQQEQKAKEPSENLQTTVSEAVEVTETTENTAATTESTEQTIIVNQIVFTDMMDREIQLDAPAEKIVILSPADCEILFAIDAGDKLIGRGEYCNYPEDVLKVDSITSGSETNIEQIIGLQPDILIMSSMAQTVEQVKQLEDAGIPVAVSESQDIEGLYAAIEMLGKITGNEMEAKVLAEDLKEGFAAIVEKIPQDQDVKTIYFEVSPLEYGLWSLGSGTFMHELAELVGLENILSDISGWAEVSQEQIIERNPDFIITTSTYMGSGPLPDEEIISRAGWSDISAIKNNAVFAVDTDIFSRAGPRLLDAATVLYEYIYGE